MKSFYEDEAFFGWMTLIWIAFILWMIFCLGPNAPCATTPRANSLGVAQEYESPYSYMFGSIHNVSIWHEDGRTYTNVEFAPYGSSVLNSVPVLFCGEIGGIDAQPRVFVYERVAHRMSHGVACHAYKASFAVTEGQ